MADYACPLSAISGRGIAISHSMLGGHEGPSLDRREALAGPIAGSLALSRHPELVIALFVGLSRLELLSSWIRLCGRQKEKREGED